MCLVCARGVWSARTSLRSPCMHHVRRVEEFRSASMRVSVTLEQYVVPAELYWAIVEFHAKRLRY